MFKKIGKYKQSLEYFEEVLSIQGTTLGHDHSDYVTALNKIGGIYFQIGNYESSLEYFEKSLSLQETTIGHNHLNYGKTLNNIGGVYELTG